MATKEERAAKQRAYVAARREKYREYQRAYEARNRDARNARQRADHAARRDERNAYGRAYKATHPEISTAYTAAHREEILSHVHTYRARKSGSDGVHTAHEWNALCEWFGGMCVCCGAQGQLSRDHVVPTIKGGTNNIGNIQPLCKRCNDIKFTKTIDYRDPVRLAAFLESLDPNE